MGAPLMGMNEQDARALTYLARRLRTETQGAGQWDEAGTWTYVSKLIGANLAVAVERVTRHAADKEARTPAAIERPFVPDAAVPSSRPEPVPLHLRCRICDKPNHAHRADDHDFEQRADLRRAPDAIHQIVEEAKGRLEQTREPPPAEDRTTGRLRELLPSPAHAAPTEES